METVKSTERVRCGQLSSQKYRSSIRSCLAASHVMSNVSLDQKEQVATSHITYADLESVDYKYLLCGQSDGGLAIYDTSVVKEGCVYGEVGSIKGGRRGTHKYQVECVQWYPADAGLFSTSSRDKKVKIWDPNRMKLVDQFDMDCHINHHQMSPVATKHSILAVAGENGEVILCDLRTGTSTHRLTGHEGPVRATQWSPRRQHILVSSGRDRTVRMWDIRTSQAFIMALDGNHQVGENSKRAKKMKRIPHAHVGQVVSFCFTHDGLWLLTFGHDGELKLWNTSTGKKMDVRYGEMLIDSRRNLRMAVTPSMHPDLVFLPCNTKVLVVEILTGRLVNVLSGHFSTVFGALYNPSSMNLYTFGNDQNFITWTPKVFESNDFEEENWNTDLQELPKRNRVTQDNWSSDEG
ncbi:DNA excision repair protein ERCC-8 [Chionoecetes opilio]|uniref:DNA excision repair protein ERCC-8 n=1 Tax=Chionoecetes opilio TaxID=41210 RepID=A0A8J4YDL0_CHIOP|nr:DNA excision repair protein ERCC-8 [Chionoecetes opilio]